MIGGGKRYLALLAGLTGGGGAVSILHGDRDAGLRLALVVCDGDGYRAVLVKGKIVRQGDGNRAVLVHADLSAVHRLPILVGHVHVDGIGLVLVPGVRADDLTGRAGGVGTVI